MPPRRSVPRQASTRIAAEQAIRSAKSSTESSSIDVVEGPSSQGIAANNDKPTQELQPSSSAQKASSGPEPVAIDLGAYTVRIAIGHDSKNTIVTRSPNAIARMPQQRRYHTAKPAGSDDASSSAYGLPAGSLVGSQIITRCTDYGALSIRQPMDRGLVVDWAAQKIILDVALREAFAQSRKGKQKDEEVEKSRGRLLEGRSVVITEAYFNLPDLQAAMDLLLTEEYGAKAIWRCAPAHLIPYTPSLFVGQRSGGGVRRARPECMCIVDLGHGASHVVPVVGDAIIWRAARRHVISQRLITNLLKEALSFRQWDMMDEPWLVGHIKEQCCFVAGSSGRRGERLTDDNDANPTTWSFAALTELCQSTPRSRNPIVQEYLLPDYSGEALRDKYGYVKSGPGAKDKAKGRPISKISDEGFIADEEKSAILFGKTLKLDEARDAKKGEAGADASEDDEDDDEDDDFDVDADSDASGEEAGTAQAKKRKQASRPEASPKKRDKTAINGDEDESEQLLVLERERFQVPEVMFNPGIIGLDDAPLHDVIKASIEACDEGVRGPLWGNIVLVGGGAAMRNIKTRLYNELRPLAPNHCPLNIWSPENPGMATIHAAQAMLTSGPQSASLRKVKSHLLPVAQYTPAAARHTFESWTQAEAANGNAIEID